MLVLEGFVGLYRTIELQLLQHYWLGNRFGLLLEWLTLDMNRNHSVVFEIASKYFILDAFVDYEATLFLLRDSCP